MIGKIDKEFGSDNSTNQRSIHWPSVWQMGFSIISITILWVISLVIVIMTIGNGLGFIESGMSWERLQLILMATGIFFVGVLLLPSGGYALLHLLRKPNPINIKLPQSSWLFLSITILLSIGFFMSADSKSSWLFLPPLHVLTLGLSALWVISLAVRHLPIGSKQRVWGIFSVGLVIAPLTSLIAELVTLITLGVVGISFLAQDPEFLTLLNQFNENYLSNPNLPINTMIEYFQPYILNPIIVAIITITITILVPLIEELFKPIGVWLLVGSKTTPSMGFAAGVLSGIGFALFENFMFSATSSSDWSLVVLGRIGTNFIHALTAGITGWALTLAWQKKKYFQLGFTYLASVCIHGLWNGFAVLSVLPEFLPRGTIYPEILGKIIVLSPVGLAVLLIGCFFLLRKFNSLLRHAIMSPVANDNKPPAG